MAGRQRRRDYAGGSIHNIDDGCLLRILACLTPLPDRFNAGSVCRRWHSLINDSRMWLRVGGNSTDDGGFITVKDAVAAARPGDTILIDPGMVHSVSSVCVDKPLCMIGGGSLPEETVLLCSRGHDSALEFLASGRVANLTIKTELGGCLLHRKGCLTIENCALKCGYHPLDHLSCPIVSTANTDGRNEVSVIETKIEGGACAVKPSRDLIVEQVRVVYARAALIFWFTVSQQRKLKEMPPQMISCKA